MPGAPKYVGTEVLLAMEEVQISKPQSFEAQAGPTTNTAKTSDHRPSNGRSDPATRLKMPERRKEPLIAEAVPRI